MNSSPNDEKASSSLWTVEVPLTNFETDGLKYERINADLELAAMTQGEIPFDHPAIHAGFMTTGDLYTMNFKLIGHYEDWTGNQDKIIGEIGDFITALRLVDGGEVGAPVLFATPDRGSVGRALDHLRSRWSVSASYRLNKSKLDEAKSFFQRIRDGAGQELRVALSRFNLSYSRNIPEDRILDLTIALESSLLRGIKDEIRYRFSLRGAALLAEKRKPEDTQKLLQAIYDVRSKIVHEGKGLADKDILEILKGLKPPILPDEFPQRCENIVRDILKEYIARLGQGGSMRDINEKLDTLIVNSLGRDFS